MQRRSILHSMLGLVTDAQAWQDPTAKLPTTAAEAAAMGLPRFFAPDDFAIFADLGQALIPPFDGRPGSLEAEAAEFLDFLLGQSPSDIQTLYKQGIATFKLRQKSGMDAALQELAAPWTNSGSSTPYAKFLNAAKLAFYQATVNSRQWAEAMATRSRGAAGIGSYWLPIE